VLAVEHQIIQVLINLLMNAAQALERSDQRESRSDFAIVVGCEVVEGALIRVFVRDYGVGIDAEARNLIDKPFMYSQSRGMGIGLSVCQTILAAHETQLRFEDVEVGTHCHFYLKESP